MLWREYLVSDWKTEKWEFWLHLKEGVPMALTFRLKLWLDLYLYFWPLSILNEWFIFHEKKNWINATRKIIILMFRCHSHHRFWVCIMPIRLREDWKAVLSITESSRFISCPTTAEKVPETIIIQKSIRTLYSYSAMNIKSINNKPILIFFYVSYIW